MSTQMQGEGDTMVREQLITTDNPADAAHIVREPEDESTTAHALVLEARVFSFEVEALCGWKWIPQRDPKHLPVCEECLALYREGVDPNEREELPDA